MKKTIFSAALLMCALVGVSASAQEPEKGQPAKFDPFEGITLTAEQQTKLDALKPEQPAQAENAQPGEKPQCDKKCDKKAKGECPKGDKKDGKKDGKKGDKKGEAPKCDKPCCQGDSAQCCKGEGPKGPKGEGPKGPKGEGPQCGQGPQGEAPQCGEQGPKGRNNECKRQYIQSVKEILTGDQYVIFLENMLLNAPAEQPGGPRGGKGPKGDGPRRGEGPCPGEAPAASADATAAE